MAEVINLRLARKAAKRATALREAEQNRARHGRTKSERDAQDKETARRDADLAGKRREDS